MATQTSTIRIRRTRGGATIRATGSAAQALCDAITASASQAKKALSQPQPQADANTVALLRSALVGLVGADSEVELREIEASMRRIPAPEAGKAVFSNAIQALLTTMPKTEAA